MYALTVQKKDVLEILLKEKKYCPDIKKSNGYDEMKLIYPYLLQTFNNLNNSDAKGIIFCFGEQYGGSFVTDVDLYQYLVNNKSVAKAFNFWNSEYVILKIKISDKINPAPIDFNDTIHLSILATKDSDRAMLLHGSIDKFNLYMKTLAMHFELGILNTNPRIKSFVEYHIPHIAIEDVVEIYSNIDINNSYDSSYKLFKLPDSALKLNSMLKHSY